MSTGIQYSNTDAGYDAAKMRIQMMFEGYNVLLWTDHDQMLVKGITWPEFWALMDNTRMETGTANPMASWWFTDDDVLDEQGRPFLDAINDEVAGE